MHPLAADVVVLVLVLVVLWAVAEFGSVHSPPLREVAPVAETVVVAGFAAEGLRCVDDFPVKAAVRLNDALPTAAAAVVPAIAVVGVPAAAAAAAVAANFEFGLESDLPGTLADQ